MLSQQTPTYDILHEALEALREIDSYRRPPIRGRRKWLIRKKKFVGDEVMDFVGDDV